MPPESQPAAASMQQGKAVAGLEMKAVTDNNARLTMLPG